MCWGGRGGWGKGGRCVASSSSYRVEGPRRLLVWSCPQTRLAPVYVRINKTMVAGLLPGLSVQ